MDQLPAKPHKVVILSEADAGIVEGSLRSARAVVEILDRVDFCEIYSYYKKHLGPRSMSAGLRVSLSFNDAPGIHYKAAISEEYRAAIAQGLRDGLAIRFADSMDKASIWISEVNEDPVDSSQMAFYLVARCVIDQAHTLTHVKLNELRDSRQG